MDRVNFIESIQGIQYPEMLVTFFDHFIALKQLVEDQGKITVLESDSNHVSFSVAFKNKGTRDSALTVINSLGGRIIIYQRTIMVDVKPLSDSEIVIHLC